MSVSDHISDQLRLQAAELRGSIIQQSRWAIVGVRPEEIAEHEARVEAKRVARRAQAEQQQAAAMAEWEALRDSVPPGKAGAVLLKVLDVHKPFLESFGQGPPTCEDCCEGGYDGGLVEWACATYMTIRDALNGET